MFNSDYTKYIKSKKWELFRKAYFSKYTRKCRVPMCRATDIELHHHKGYSMLGHERPSDVMPLCRLHHKQVHFEHRRGGRKESIQVVTLRFVSNKQFREQVQGLYKKKGYK